jgi:hypothetical protein
MKNNIKRYVSGAMLAIAAVFAVSGVAVADVGVKAGGFVGDAGIVYVAELLVNEQRAEAADYVPDIGVGYAVYHYQGGFSYVALPGGLEGFVALGYRGGHWYKSGSYRWLDGNGNMEITDNVKVSYLGVSRFDVGWGALVS